MTVYSVSVMFISFATVHLCLQKINIGTSELCKKMNNTFIYMEYLFAILSCVVYLVV
jgi:hypothetical protein